MNPPMTQPASDGMREFEHRLRALVLHVREDVRQKDTNSRDAVSLATNEVVALHAAALAEVERLKASLALTGYVDLGKAHIEHNRSVMERALKAEAEVARAFQQGEGYRVELIAAQKQLRTALEWSRLYDDAKAALVIAMARADEAEKALAAEVEWAGNLPRRPAEPPASMREAFNAALDALIWQSFDAGAHGETSVNPDTVRAVTDLFDAALASRPTGNKA